MISVDILHLGQYLGGGRVSMPYYCATTMTLSKSGATGGGRFKGSSIVSQASSRYFSMTPPGDCTISIRAGVSPAY